MKIGTTTNLIPQNISPTNAKNLAIFDGETKVCNVPLGHLARQNIGEKKYSVGLLSDIHVSKRTADNKENDQMKDLRVALEYFNTIDKFAFTCVCGDLTTTGSDNREYPHIEEYGNYIHRNYVSSYKDTYATIHHPVYSIAGNHEAYGGKAEGSAADMGSTEEMIAWFMRKYTKVPLYYTISSNPTTDVDENGVIYDGGNIQNTSLGANDVFIMTSIVKSWGLDLGNVTTDIPGIQWLYDTLEANRNKRCFLFQHLRPKDACGNAYNIGSMGGSDDEIWCEEQSVVFENLMKHYKNVYYFHGHTHVDLSLQTRDNLANIDDKYGRYSIHIPSAYSPRKLKDDGSGKEGQDSKSQGYLMDVYKNHIVLRGRDFVDGVFIPVAQYCLDTTIKPITAGTFTDSTGTIMT